MEANQNNNFSAEENEISANKKNKIWKFYLVFIVLTAGLLTIIGRLFYLQVIHADEYKKKAMLQHETKIPLQAERGSIYDRNGILLASSIKSISLAVDPSMLTQEKQLTEVSSLIDKYCDMPISKVKDKIRHNKSSFMWINRGIIPASLDEFKKLNYPGLIKKEEPKRNYLFGSVASQLLGYTNIDSKGLTGIELGYDSLLQGRNGFIIMFRDAMGRLRPSPDLPKFDAVNGKSLQLTIDIVLQRIAEFELKRGVEMSQAESGTIVAVRPQTGEVLAMASYPNYNPNDLKTLSEAGLKNRAITDAYEPGSTFKLITAAAAVEEGIIHPDDIVDGNNGLLEFKDFRIRDDHPIGRVAFREAFQKSSNIVFSNLASNLPENKFFKYIRDFGFGLTLGIDIPGEVSGKLKRIEEFDAIARRFAGFGYGVLVTPLQMVMAYAAIAQGGEIYRPYIIKSIFDSKGDTLIKYSPQIIRRVVSKETCKTLTELLTGVVDYGTGVNAKINGLKIAGKTGTAQQLVEGSYAAKSYVASFAGFFPAENPQIAMIVVLDKPKGNYYGGSVAAPIFRNITQRWLAIQPDITLCRIAEIVNSRTGITTVPGLKGMNLNDAKLLLNSNRLQCQYYGDPNGIIVDQFPSALSSVKDFSTVKINLNQIAYMNDSLKAKFYPDLRGLTPRRAMTVLHQAGIRMKVQGSGIIVEQIWGVINKKERICTLICK